MLQRLLQDAAAPYFEVLSKWIATGILDDPFSEFMVVEVPGMNVDAELDGQSAFWVGGHKLRSRTAADGTEVLDVPVFLFDVQDEVLKAGAHRICAHYQQQTGVFHVVGFCSRARLHT